MNEISLSDDLNVITAEINSYKQVAGQAIFEIGKRLKHVKENDLVHGEWINWLKSIEMDRSEAHRFINVATKLGSENVETFQHLGLSALNLIATMPEQEREQSHEVPSTGEEKTPDEMTVKELREVKKQLKQEQQARKDAETREQSAKKSEQIATKKLEDEQNKEPEVKEVTKEVVPDEVQRELESKQRLLNFSDEEIERLKQENESYKTKDSTEFDEEKAERERKKLEWEADKNVLQLKIKVDKFMEEVSITAFMEGAIASSSKTTKEKLHESVNEMKSFANKMESTLKGRIDIQGGDQ